MFWRWPLGVIVGGLLGSVPSFGVDGPVLSPPQMRVLQAADWMLNNVEASYVMGGNMIEYDAEAGARVCAACRDCLNKYEGGKSKNQSIKRSEAARRCTMCAQCSVDCSHFTEMVYMRAGVPYPYLATSLMLRASAAELKKHYKLIDLGLDLVRAEPGDLFVYDGHVVIVERLTPDGLGDLVHATSGKDIRRPGEGIQRERHVDLRNFRGPLRRVLRHEFVAMTLSPLNGRADGDVAKRPSVLRPVTDRPPTRIRRP